MIDTTCISLVFLAMIIIMTIVITMVIFGRGMTKRKSWALRSTSSSG